MKKKIVVVAFDGVLHSYERGWHSAEVVGDPPVPGAIEWLEQMVRDGRFKVHILSSRSHQIGGVVAMYDWLADNGLSAESLKELYWPHHKPPAHMSIDDRGWYFTGEFPSPDEVADFRPWWKKTNELTAGKSLEWEEVLEALDKGKVKKAPGGGT